MPKFYLSDLDTGDKQMKDTWKGISYEGSDTVQQVFYIMYIEYIKFNIYSVYT